MRRELRARGINHLKVVYSEEAAHEPHRLDESEITSPGKRTVPGSISFVPSVVGLIMAGEIIKDITK